MVIISSCQEKSGNIMGQSSPKIIFLIILKPAPFFRNQHTVSTPPRMGISIFCLKIFIFHIFLLTVVHICLFLLEPLSQKSGNLDQIGHEKVRKVRKSDPLLAVDTLSMHLFLEELEYGISGISDNVLLYSSKARLLYDYRYCLCTNKC